MTAILDDDNAPPGRGARKGFRISYTVPMSNRSRYEHRFPSGSRCKARKAIEDGAMYCMGHMSAHT